MAQPPPPPSWLLWLFTWGEPSVTVGGPAGGLMTWLKVLGLFCLLGWVLSWIVAALKEQSGRARGLLDLAALGALIAGAVATLLGVIASAGQLIAPLQRVPIFLGTAAALVLLVWVEAKLWSILRRRWRRMPHCSMKIGEPTWPFAGARARVMWMAPSPMPPR